MARELTATRGACNPATAMAAKITVMRPNATRYAPRDPPASCGNSELTTAKRSTPSSGNAEYAWALRAAPRPWACVRWAPHAPQNDASGTSAPQYGQTVARNEVGAASLLRLVIGS